MLNRKGQGLTEYGIILLLILGVGMGVWSSSGIGGNVTEMYNSISNKLALITGETYDTDEPVDQSKGKAGRYFPAKATTLKFTVGGKEYRILYRTEGITFKKNSQGKPILDSDGNRIVDSYANKYKVYCFEESNQSYNGTEGLMASKYLSNSIDWSYANTGDNGEYTKNYFTNDDGSTVTYFNIGNQTYQITDYKTSSTPTKDAVLTKYTGNDATIKAMAASRTTTIENNLRNK